MAKQLKDILESFDFNRAALAKQRLQNLRHQGRKVRGARIANLMRAAGLKEEELDETELDQLDEVLSADAKAEDWIHDFVHSDAPQFSGKSKKERIKMALGAYYNTKNKKDGSGVNESAKKYAGLEKEDKKGLPTALVKKSEKAVEGDTVEGWDHPHDAVKKESYDEEGNLISMPKSFKEFMEGMTATKVAPNVTRYTGGSYGNAKGAKYGNTDYDHEDLDKKDDEGQEQQKRGRGRPAGSKSGARGPRIK